MDVNAQPTLAPTVSCIPTVREQWIPWIPLLPIPEPLSNDIRKALFSTCKDDEQTRKQMEFIFKHVSPDAWMQACLGTPWPKRLSRDENCLLYYIAHYDEVGQDPPT